MKEKIPLFRKLFTWPWNSATWSFDFPFSLRRQAVGNLNLQDGHDLAPLTNMSGTYYSFNRVLDRNFGGTAYTPPATMYFGLSTTTIQIDGTGATEPSGGSYARVAFTNDKTNWAVAANGSLTNLVAIQFPESTASWGTITTVFIADALTSGNIWWFDTLSPSKTVQSATTVLFAIGAVTVLMNNS